MSTQNEKSYVCRFIIINNSDVSDVYSHIIFEYDYTYIVILIIYLCLYIVETLYQKFKNTNLTFLYTDCVTVKVLIYIFLYNIASIIHRFTVNSHDLKNIYVEEL